MSILINMEMPKCCDDCFALDDNGDYPYCLISSTQQGYTFRTREKRMSNCPLVEAPEQKYGKNLNEEWPSLFECSICHWSCWDTYCGDTDTYNYCPNCGAIIGSEA